MVDTPVLFLIFNRPENTKQVFEAIRNAKPKKLFIAADGPRVNKEGEFNNCLRSREIAANVDWDCDVKTLFRDNNLGCKLAVSSGIDWFFENVDEGIILEDDCVPDASFFGFCEKLLSYYRLDTRIMMICGTNYLSNEINKKIEHSYFFSNYYPIWGWATWKRAWRLYDEEMKSWEEFRKKRNIHWLFPKPVLSNYYESMFDLIYNKFDTWDVQWWFTCIFQNGLSIAPKSNLISNKGIVGTHSNTQSDFFIDEPTVPLDLKDFKHPKYIFPERFLNEMTYVMSHAQININEFSDEAKNYSTQVSKPDEILNSFPASVIFRNFLQRFIDKMKG